MDALPGPDTERVISHIQELAPSASRRFLEHFDPGELRRYLDHLTATSVPRGPTARWVRPDAPAITAREARE
ncbi:MAG TPA: hypothetical protein VD963_04375 [Phycisphaerales bacterium]|nr:hypothetical protein [Phycisphaerales bacterium]